MPPRKRPAEHVSTDDAAAKKAMRIRKAQVFNSDPANQAAKQAHLSASAFPGSPVKVEPRSSTPPSIPMSGAALRERTARQSTSENHGISIPDASFIPVESVRSTTDTAIPGPNARSRRDKAGGVWSPVAEHHVSPRTHDSKICRPRKQVRNSNAGAAGTWDTYVRVLTTLDPSRPIVRATVDELIQQELAECLPTIVPGFASRLDYLLQDLREENVHPDWLHALQPMLRKAEVKRVSDWLREIFGRDSDILRSACQEIFDEQHGSIVANDGGEMKKLGAFVLPGSEQHSSLTTAATPLSRIHQPTQRIPRRRQRELLIDPERGGHAARHGSLLTLGQQDIPAYDDSFRHPDVSAVASKTRAALHGAVKIPFVKPRAGINMLLFPMKAPGTLLANGPEAALLEACKLAYDEYVPVRVDTCGEEFWTVFLQTLPSSIEQPVFVQDIQLWPVLPMPAPPTTFVAASPSPTLTDDDIAAMLAQTFHKEFRLYRARRLERTLFVRFYTPPGLLQFYVPYTDDRAQQAYVLFDGCDASRECRHCGKSSRHNAITGLCPGVKRIKVDT